MSKPWVKVCCISSLEEAKTALSLGADWLGLVSEMPSGPGVISLKTIADIVSGLPPETRTVLLTSKRTAHEIHAQHARVKTWGIQLVDSLTNSELKKLRELLPATFLVQVIHVRGKRSVSEALSYVDKVDALLLDSGDPTASIKTLGGTGTTHDWDVSREICEKSSLPVLLAGGLNSENIFLARSLVDPDGYDLCSGVRREGQLDLDKLTEFMRLVHN